MKPTEPLQLHHSWPLFERERRFELGAAFSWPASAPVPATGALPEELAEQGVGLWSCDLSDNSLTWSWGVYDIFGIPRGTSVRREEAVALYSDGSRAAMESLRAYAIKHRRGFTLDAELRPAQGGPRWMRLIAVPVCDGRRVVGLHGAKRLI